MQILSCCNSLNVVEKQLVGDPIEIKMLKKTGFQFQDINYFSHTNTQNDGIYILPSRSFLKN